MAGKGKKLDESSLEQKNLSLKIKGLIDGMKKRIQFSNTLRDSFNSEELSTPLFNGLASLLEILNKDAQKTIESANKYLETVSYFKSSDLQNAELLRMIDTTIDAAQLIFDKRLLEIIQRAEQVVEKYAKITNGYAKSMGLKEQEPAVAAAADSSEGNVFDENIWELFESDVPSEGVAPATREVIGLLLDKLNQLGNPYRPHFSQSRAENKFSETQHSFTSSEEIMGALVEDIGQQIKKGDINKEVINVSVFYHDRAWVCANNRSLAAASLSGVEPRLEVIFPTREFIDYYDHKKAEGQPSLGIKHPKSPKKSTEVDLFSIVLEDKAGKPTRPVRVPPEWEITSLSDFYKQRYKKISQEPSELSKEKAGPADDTAAAAAARVPVRGR